MKARRPIIAILAAVASMISLGASFAPSDCMAQANQCCCVRPQIVPPSQSCCNTTCTNPWCSGQCYETYTQPTCWKPGTVGCAYEFGPLPVGAYDCVSIACIDPPNTTRCALAFNHSTDVGVLKCAQGQLICVGTPTQLCADN
jgi:hypothetical protein